MSTDLEKMSPTQEIINNCIEDLCDEIVIYTSEKEASEIKWEANQEVKKYKICCFVKSQKAFEIYTNLDLCVAIGAQKQSQLIGENVKVYSQADDDLEKSLKEAIKSIKGVKNILADVSDKACKLDRCVEEEERCNPDILTSLIKGVPEFKKKIEILKSRPQKCYDSAVKAFDGGVDVAGIQSFTDLGSIVTMSEELIKSVDAFKADIDKNIIKSLADIQDGKTELTEILQETETITYEKCTAETDLSGTSDTKDYICDPDCEDIDDDEIDRLCRKVKKNFSEDEEDDHYPCDDKDKKKKRPSADQKQEQQHVKGDDEEWSISE